MTKRDVHFAQFAQLLARELTDAGVFFDATGQGQHIIAQRAYDLVYSVIEAHPDEIEMAQWGGASPEEIHTHITSLPDLTQWPEYQEPRLFEPDTWSFNQPTERER